MQNGCLNGYLLHENHPKVIIFYDNILVAFTVIKSLFTYAHMRIYPNELFPKMYIFSTKFSGENASN